MLGDPEACVTVSLTPVHVECVTVSPTPVHAASETISPTLVQVDCVTVSPTPVHAECVTVSLTPVHAACVTVSPYLYMQVHYSPPLRQSTPTWGISITVCRVRKITIADSNADPASS